MGGGMWTVQAASNKAVEKRELQGSDRIVEGNRLSVQEKWKEMSAKTTSKPALNKTSAILIKGQTLQLTLKDATSKVTWSSSDKSVASVNTAGKVTAKKKGTATITAKCGQKKYSCKVTVETPKLNKTSITVTEGKTYKLELSGTVQTVKWSSSDRAVAKVGSTGRVRGIKVGECTITAKIGKKKYTCHVKVMEETSETTVEKKPDTGTETENGKEPESLPVAEIPTQQQVYAAILAMQSEYPEGMAWTNDNFYSWKGGIYSGGGGCAGFAFAMSDAAFGDLPARIHTDYSKIYVGDILRVNNNTHSVIVLEVTDTEVVVAEGNYNSAIHWGRRIGLDELQGEGNYIMTRYPNQA